MTSKNPHPSPSRKVRRGSDQNKDSDSEWDGDSPSDGHDIAEQDGVIGEVEKPAPPSEKPEAG
jgi:hypothetical protein